MKIIDCVQGSTEEWRPCLAGEYEVSSLGRVRNVRTGRVRALSHRRDHYASLNVRHRTVPVHRLVAAAFIGSRPRGLEVNHKNGDKNDPRAVNLEYVTRSDNMRHAYRLGLKHFHGKPFRHARGEEHGRARLTEADVRETRRRAAAGETQLAIAVSFGVAKQTVGKILRGENWRHLV